MDIPLFDLSDKDLIRFAYNNRNKFIIDVVAPEMTRRLNVSITKFNRQSSEQSTKMINLTRKIIGLTIVLGIMAFLQAVLLIKQI